MKDYKMNERCAWAIAKVLPLAAVMLVLVTLQTQAQHRTEDQLNAFFSEIRSGKMPAEPRLALRPEQVNTIVAILETYQQDSVAAVRAGVYKLLNQIGNASSPLFVRQKVVASLLKGGSDSSKGNAGLAIAFLTAFQKSDYTNESLEAVRGLFYKSSEPFDVVLKLAGYLDLVDLQELMRPYTRPGNLQSVRWAALLTLARMNDARAIQEVMRRVRKPEVNDDLVYTIFPDLVYTRQAEAFDYMVEVLYSNDNACNSADPERVMPIPCGYLIMEMLAAVIASYPLKVDASGDMVSNDYTVALQTVRDWFTKHPDYTILKDRY